MKFRRLRKRGQAVFFDSLMFVTIVTFSAALLYVALDNYGTAREQTYLTAYYSNSMENIMKSLYNIDSSTLVNVEPKRYLPEGQAEEYYPECAILKDYGGNSVADLMKADAADGRLDDKSCALNQNKEKTCIVKPGRTALFCAMMPATIPMTLAGYAWNAELIDNQSKWIPTASSGTGYVTTNLGAFKPDNQEQPPCENPTVTGASRNLVVRSPFRVPYFVQKGGEEVEFASHEYSFRICVWPRR